jgi:hypothetical protein
MQTEDSCVMAPAEAAERGKILCARREGLGEASADRLFEMGQRG